MPQGFEAQIRAHFEKAWQKAEAITKQSIVDLCEIAQTPVAQGGKMPVDTGFLRNSFVSQLLGSSMLTGPDAFVLTVADFELGDVYQCGWVAEYALSQEYGSRGRSGRHFARSAAQQWQDIVSRNARAAA